jgi:hypothetical protein
MTRRKAAMKNTIWVKLVLAVSGVVAVGIGLSILLGAKAFYASSGIILGDNSSQLSEIKAPAMVLLAFGTAMLGAVFISRIREFALMSAAMLYLSYGLGRVFSMVSDGVPHTNIQMAMGIELAIGLVCAVVMWRHRDRAQMVIVPGQ